MDPETTTLLLALIFVPDAWSNSTWRSFPCSRRCFHITWRASLAGSYFKYLDDHIKIWIWLHAEHGPKSSCEIPFFFQLCSGVDENAVGVCSELVFAPIDEMFPDDAPLLPSGFRVIPLDSKSVELKHFPPEPPHYFLLSKISPVCILTCLVSIYRKS